MFKLDLGKSEEPEIKLPIYVGESKKQESSRKLPTSALLIMPKLLTVWITTNWKIFQEMGAPDHETYLLRNLYAGQGATVRTEHGTTDWCQSGKEYIKVAYCHPDYLTYMQSIHQVKYQSGWSTTWKQDCPKKYQQSQICR